MKISKETFVNAINNVMNFEDRLFTLNELGVEIREMVEETDLSNTVINIIDEMTNEGGWVQTYAYDLDFGRDCETDIIVIDGDELNVSSVENFYDSLVELED